MRINNVKVYDLEESLKASGFAMRTIADSSEEVTEKDWNRGLNLVKAVMKSGGNPAHAQWLTGVRVAFDLTFSNKAWVEAERYRFLEFVTSQSTMHRISKFDIAAQCNKYVLPETIEIVEKLKEKYIEDSSKENYLYLLYNTPAGFEITARMTTNYRCLLNIYVQRHDHRLPEWREFCEELLTLPHFKEIVTAYYEGGTTINETDSSKN